MSHVNDKSVSSPDAGTTPPPAGMMLLLNVKLPFATSPLSGPLVAVTVKSYVTELDWATRDRETEPDQVREENGTE